MTLAPSPVCGPSVPPNTLSIGTVGTGQAAASVTGAAPNQILNLTLPAGMDGVTTWEVGKAYASGAVVQGSDKNVYRSLVGSNVGFDHTTNDGTQWVMAYAAVATNLSVASDGRFTSLGAAVAFVASAAFGALVTISIAAGTYTATSTVTFPAQAGAMIAVVGAGSGSTVLQFNGCSGISVPTGCVGLDVRSLTVRGNSTASTVAVHVSRGGYLNSTDDLKLTAFPIGANV